MERVLIIEDDILIAELERDYLVSFGYDTVIVGDGEKGLKSFSSQKFDLVLLDIMLPGKYDGFDVLREIRSVSEIPIIIITGKKEDISIIEGLGLGADDYIIKPFSPLQMIARARSAINRYQKLTAKAMSEQKYIRNDLVIDCAKRTVTVDNQSIELANKEYLLLLFLVENEGVTFSKEDLYKEIWHEGYGDLRTVTVHINRLRDKIESDSANPKYIETVRGEGYRFKVIDNIVAEERE